MIYMLLNNEVISASALADKYQVSQRTIYRDIDAISAAGIPVVSYQGVHGGYGIMESYKMDRSLLGSHDVESLITLLNGLSTVFSDEQASETVRKLRTIQKEGSSPSLTLDIGSRRGPNESLRLLRAAIKARKVVRFEYVSAKNERLTRIVEPVCLMYKNQVWYLHAFCRGRSDYREFKLTRMSELAMLPEQYHKVHPVPAERQTGYRRFESANPVTLVLHFSPQALARSLDFFHEAERCFQEDGSLLIKLRLSAPAEMNWLLPLILSFGDDVEIVEPIEFREQIRSKLESMLLRYR
ncbi:helix-turn-helix transcriptional regulator [Paenibacillus silviterrae]|jgi:predicted DNA-binding transcriptional regulator YafY|nr:YafY family protein [Paenibacillus chinjuensis]